MVWNQYSWTSSIFVSTQNIHLVFEGAMSWNLPCASLYQVPIPSYPTLIMAYFRLLTAPIVQDKHR